MLRTQTLILYSHHLGASVELTSAHTRFCLFEFLLFVGNADSRRLHSAYMISTRIIYDTVSPFNFLTSNILLLLHLLHNLLHRLSSYRLL